MNVTEKPGQAIGFLLGRLERAEALLKRVLDDEHFGIGLSEDIRNYLATSQFRPTCKACGQPWPDYMTAKGTHGCSPSDAKDV